MDLIFIIEILIVGIIVIIQFYIFFQNNKRINVLGELFPEQDQLKTHATSVAGEDKQPITLDLISDAHTFSPEFREIVHHTNAYISKNKGQADFELLKEIAEGKTESKEHAIESSIPLPLYIGLLATFTGVIIGLIRIASTGVSDQAIQSFIGGVLIGMIGSAAGLALTVSSNALFRRNREEKDRKTYSYLTFLRIYILPALQKDGSAPTQKLRASLAAFHEGFTEYQSQVHTSLKDSAQLFDDLKISMQNMQSLQQGISGMHHMLQANDNLIEKQVGYINSYTEQAESFSRKLGEHFKKVDTEMNTLVNEQIDAIGNSAQRAYMKMDQYLAQSSADEAIKFAEGLQGDLGKIRDSLTTTQDRQNRINTQILEQLGAETQSRQQLSMQLEGLKQVMVQMTSGSGGDGDFLQSPSFKWFVYSGTTIFLLSLAAGVGFLATQFM